MPRVDRVQGQIPAAQCVELHSPRVRICNDGSQVVDVRHLVTFLRRCFQSRIVMFPIMKLLCTEETMDLIRNSSVRIISVFTKKVNAKIPCVFEGVTHPRSGPTSLFAVVSKLLAAHPETYTTSSHRAICVICAGSTAPSVCTGWPSLAALLKMA